MSDSPTRLFQRAYESLPLRLRLRRECARMLAVEEELAVVADLLTRGSVLVDVGANVGSYVGVGVLARAQVTAVEPLPDLAERLRARFGSRVRVVQAACSPTAGVATLHVPHLAGGQVVHTRSSLLPDANEGYDSVEVTVDLIPLDDVSSHADVLKIDVEGFEAQVLASAPNLLSASRPAVLVEVERRHHSEDPWAAFALLTSYGYQGFFLAGDHRLSPLTDFVPDVHQPVGVAKDPSSAARPEGYVNNFLFLHPSRPSQRARLIAAGWAIASI